MQTFQPHLPEPKPKPDDAGGTPISENWHAPTVYQTTETTELPPGEPFSGPARTYITIRDKEVAERIAYEPNYLRRLKMALDAENSVFHIKDKSLPNITEAVDIIYVKKNSMAYKDASTTLLARFYNPWISEELEDEKYPEFYDPTVVEQDFNYPNLEKYTEEEEVTYFSETIHFTVNNELFESKEVTRMARTAKMIKYLMSESNDQPYKLIVKGHASEEGKEVNNMALSRRRADNIKHYFIAAGIPANLIEAKGYGESFPLPYVDQSKEAGRARNRRAELSLVKLDSAKKEEDRVTDKCIGWNLDDFNIELIYHPVHEQRKLRFYLKHEKYGIERGTFAGAIGPVQIYKKELDKVGLAESFKENNQVWLSTEELSLIADDEHQWKMFAPVIGSHWFEEGNPPFDGTSFMKFWNQLLMIGDRAFRKYEGNEVTPDTYFAAVRDAIRDHGLDSEYPEWVDLANCKNLIYYDEEEEKKALLWRKVLSNVDAYQPIGNSGAKGVNLLKGRTPQAAKLATKAKNKFYKHMQEMYENSGEEESEP